MQKSELYIDDINSLAISVFDLIQTKFPLTLGEDDDYNTVVRFLEEMAAKHDIYNYQYKNYN